MTLAGKTDDFVENVLGYTQEQRGKTTRLINEGWDFEKVLKKAAEAVDLPPLELLRGGRANARSQGRALLCKWMVFDLKETQVKIAEKMGVTRAAISLLAKRGIAVEQELGVKLE